MSDVDEAVPVDEVADEVADEAVEADEVVDEAVEADDDFEDDGWDDAGCAERVLEVCLRAIVDSPDEIEIDVDERGSRVTLHARVAPTDMGKIIGKRGRVANALRTLVKAAGTRDGVSAGVEIDD